MIIDFKIFELKNIDKYLILYKDDLVSVYVINSFDSCKKFGEDTDWCSNEIDGFYSHNETANMFRFVFSDGYKLRLTWDYINRNASINTFSGGSHWGSGGYVNGEKIPYNYIRPLDNDEPFLFYYEKGDERTDMVKRIESISQDAIDVVTDYQNKNSTKKSNILTKLYKQINNIKIVDIIEDVDDIGLNVTYYKLTIKYNNKEYILRTLLNNNVNKFFVSLSTIFMKNFNRYGVFDKYNTLNIYFNDKIKEFLKNKKINLF